ncbi:MAG: PEP-CTERM sorting domain-containing protein [Colwellia sp.]|nr:PEP-CTERM sorting domain-containing protein [Colwellia sp.]
MFNRLPKFISAFLLIITTTASAGIIDLTASESSISDEFIYSQDGVILTVSAWVTNVTSDSDDTLDQLMLMPWQRLSGPYGVYQGTTGLGVISSDIDGNHLDGGRFDEPKDLDEGLLFSFSENVNFMDFWAVYLTENDDLNFSTVQFITSTSIKTTDIFWDVSGIPPVGHTFGDEYDDVFGLYPGIIGKNFMIWVDGDDDDVRIGDVGFTKVPEPNTLFLFSLVLIGMAIRRRI